MRRRSGGHQFTLPADRDGPRPAAQARSLPRPQDPKAVETAWPYLGHPDRFVRWAARVAIEFQDPATWRERALAETSSPEATLNALLALTQVSVRIRHTASKTTLLPTSSLRDQILAALDKLAWDKLSRDQQLDLLRVYEVVLNRFGRPDESTSKSG